MVIAWLDDLSPQSDSVEALLKFTDPPERLVATSADVLRVRRISDLTDRTARELC